MDKIYTKARAKVNLSLNVLDKRKDNYHNLESIFQKINLYDELYLEKNDKETLELITNLKNVELENNIIYKAYIKLKEKYNTIKGVKVTLNKRIPTQAGLAGGSTDCASFILAMNKLYNLNLTEKELIDLGKTLGADVCPCYYNKAVLYYTQHPESLINIEKFVMAEILHFANLYLPEIVRDYNEASYLYPFWKNYPPLDRGRSPIGDQYPWIEVGEQVFGNKEAR